MKSNIKSRREYFVTTASSTSGEINEDTTTISSFCQRCLGLGFYNLLKERLYRKDELIQGEKPQDWELWKQCHTCGTIVALVHAPIENQLAGIKDVPDSIHDTRKLTVEHFVQSRRNDINRKVKRVDRTDPADTDMDVKPKTDRGSKLVSYETSDR